MKVIVFISWLLFWAITLFSIDIHVRYRNGFEINFNGWWGKLFK